MHTSFGDTFVLFIKESKFGGYVQQL